MMLRTVTLIATMAIANACGGADDLTCELLEDPGNCWARAAAAARACLPEPAEVGVLAADRGSCSFSDGASVVFDAPLPDFTEQLERLAFTIESGGAECARFVDTFENRMELTAGGLSVVSQLRADTFELDCGDESFESSFDLLFTCQPGSGPTDGFSVAPDLFTFSIISSATPSELFTCEPP
jgi:hypothetical protein